MRDEVRQILVHCLDPSLRYIENRCGVGSVVLQVLIDGEEDACVLHVLVSQHRVENFE
ncbi:hypothetical protein R4P70_30775 [Rhodococcus sp. IEGM 1241]|uniref:hypothetical protein n=1 Tax=Rhodococcus sp. IEGM 1241 TaxID=3082228 RepID=UPI00295487A6|nr:hypothetical protein [Rhodococcus sp. IEGM 1241]MDV8015710.1 hypothetical protein [Rhodococcus sp. IEGM 1241]